MKNSFCSRCLPLYGAFAMKVPMLSVMQRVISIVIMTVIVVFGAVYAFYVRPWDSGVIASYEATDGSRYMVGQKDGSLGEFYDVKLFSQTPGDDWRSSYLDHESGSWRNTSFEYDPITKRVIVMESGIERYVVDRAKTAVIGAPTVPPFPFPETESSNW